MTRVFNTLNYIAVAARRQMFSYIAVTLSLVHFRMMSSMINNKQRALGSFARVIITMREGGGGRGERERERVT